MKQERKGDKFSVTNTPIDPQPPIGWHFEDNLPGD